jgi:hypothetical protein
LAKTDAQTVESYEAKQMNQPKPVINIAEEFQQSLSDEKPPSAHTDKQREARKAEKSEVATRFLKFRAKKPLTGEDAKSRIYNPAKSRAPISV